MPTISERVRILLQGQDQASRPVTQAARRMERSLKGISRSNREVSSTARQASSSQQRMARGFQGIERAATFITGGALAFGVVRVTQRLHQMVQSGERAIALRQGFDRLASSVGVDGAQAIERAADAMGHLASRTELMQRFNQLVLLGVPVTTDSFEKMAAGATALARAMGIDASFALESLAVGIGRQSRLWLDNLGIIVDTEAAYRRHADALNKTTEQLTEQEQKVAFLNATMEGLDQRVLQLGEVSTAVSGTQQLRAAFDDLTDAISTLVAQDSQVQGFFSGMAESIRGVISALQDGGFENIAQLAGMSPAEVRERLSGAGPGLRLPAGEQRPEGATVSRLEFQAGVQERGGGLPGVRQLGQPSVAGGFQFLSDTPEQIAAGMRRLQTFADNLLRASDQMRPIAEQIAAAMPIPEPSAEAFLEGLAEFDAAMAERGLEMRKAAAAAAEPIPGVAESAAPPGLGEALITRGPGLAEQLAEEEARFQEQQDRIEQTALERAAQFAAMRVELEAQSQGNITANMQEALEIRLGLLEDEIERRRALVEEGTAADQALLQEKTEREGVLREQNRQQTERTEQQKRDMQMQSAAAFVGVMSQVFGKSKSMAIASAIMETWLAANRALSGPPGAPWTIPIMLATIATGFKNVQQIRKQNFQGGGLVRGGQPGFDTTPIPFAGRGELVVDASDVSALVNGRIANTVIGPLARSGIASGPQINLSVSVSAPVMGPVMSDMQRFHEQVAESVRDGIRSGRLDLETVLGRSR